MSIWSSGALIGHDGAGIELPRGDVRAYADGWSNHYPTTDGNVEVPASVDLASIAPWCVPSHDEQDGCGRHDYPECGPWLRLGVHANAARSWWTKDADGNPAVAPVCADVVMDEEAVRALVDDLNKWLARPKVRPMQGDQRADDSGLVPQNGETL